MIRAVIVLIVLVLLVPGVLDRVMEFADEAFEEASKIELPKVELPEQKTPGKKPGTKPAATKAPGGTSGKGDLVAAISRLEPAAELARGDYSRDRFDHWIDADGDGCDTRDEILLDEALSAPDQGPGCSLDGGRWRSRYDGLVFTDAGALDIDHVVALAEAWDSGAAEWSDESRSKFANDLGVDYALIAVSAASNRSKSDRDPAEWLPPDTGDHCLYVADWVAVKLRWDLAVDPAELDALRDIAGRSACAGTSLPG